MNMTTPLYSRAAAFLGRPLVLLASLVMSAPAEISLARTAGFHGGFEYLAPLVLSLYAVCAAVIAATRLKGVRGRLSAIIGAAMALGFALSAQVVAHLIAAGYVTSGPWLVAAVSAVPSVAAAHLLHLAVVPKTPTIGVTNEESGRENQGKPVNGSETDQDEPKAIAPAAPRKKRSQNRSKPSLALIKETAKAIEGSGKRVSGPALAAALGVSDRSGYRYMQTLAA